MSQASSQSSAPITAGSIGLSGDSLSLIAGIALAALVIWFVLKGKK